MFNFCNFHFKGEISEQAMSSHLVQGCWWGGKPEPLLKEKLRKQGVPPAPQGGTELATPPPTKGSRWRGWRWGGGGQASQVCRQAVLRPDG